LPPELFEPPSGFSQAFVVPFPLLRDLLLLSGVASPAAISAKNPIIGLNKIEMNAHPKGFLFRSLATYPTSPARASQNKKPRIYMDEMAERMNEPPEED
jgi:hypothetical protein